MPRRSAARTRGAAANARAPDRCAVGSYYPRTRPICEGFPGGDAHARLCRRPEPRHGKPCHDILSVSGYFRRLNADTRRTMCLSLRQERQQVYTGCDKHGFSTHNTLFFLVLCLNDNFLPISEALCKSSEVK